MIAVAILVLASLAGVLALLRARAPRALDRWAMIALIDDFLEGRRGDWEWEAAWAAPGDSYGMDAFKDIVANVPKEFPPDRPGVVCNAAGMARLRALRDELLAHAV